MSFKKKYSRKHVMKVISFKKKNWSFKQTSKQTNNKGYMKMPNSAIFS